MRVGIPVVLLLSLLLVMTLASCGRQAAPPPAPDGPGAGPPPAPPPSEPAAPPAGEKPVATTEAPPSEAAAAPEDVVKEVGAPLYEGAEAKGSEAKDGATVATFLTSAAYKDVKAFYLEKLKEPDWKNNGMEMSPLGADEWEFKTADGNKLVLVKKDPKEPKTEIRFTLKGK
ncbi:MAG: hypothetical protein KKI08_13590 [Armatimonadetes bacterium]|nr:hypothetical protein [Armatimonadota bacterium]